MGLTATSQNTAKALQAYWVAEEMLDGAVRLGLPQDALFACNLILQLANYCYVCVVGLPEADRQTAFAAAACCTAGGQRSCRTPGRCPMPCGWRSGRWNRRTMGYGSCRADCSS